MGLTNIIRSAGSRVANAVIHPRKTLRDAIDSSKYNIQFLNTDISTAVDALSYEIHAPSATKMLALGTLVAAPLYAGAVPSVRDVKSRTGAKLTRAKDGKLKLSSKDLQEMVNFTYRKGQAEAVCETDCPKPDPNAKYRQCEALNAGKNTSHSIDRETQYASCLPPNTIEKLVEKGATVTVLRAQDYAPNGGACPGTKDDFVCAVVEMDATPKEGSEQGISYRSPLARFDQAILGVDESSLTYRVLDNDQVRNGPGTRLRVSKIITQPKIGKATILDADQGIIRYQNSPKLKSGDSVTIEYEAVLVDDNNQVILDSKGEPYTSRALMRVTRKEAPILTLDKSGVQVGAEFGGDLRARLLLPNQEDNGGEAHGVLIIGYAGQDGDADLRLRLGGGAFFTPNAESTTNNRTPYVDPSVRGSELHGDQNAWTANAHDRVSPYLTGGLELDLLESGYNIDLRGMFSAAWVAHGQDNGNLYENETRLEPNPNGDGLVPSGEPGQDYGRRPENADTNYELQSVVEGELKGQIPVTSWFALTLPRVQYQRNLTTDQDRLPVTAGLQFDIPLGKGWNLALIPEGGYDALNDQGVGFARALIYHSPGEDRQ